jgi:hypothetical protein
MQQTSGSIAGFYRAQVESAQDLTAASMEGFERIHQLTLQALRQQLDNQFRLVSNVTTRTAEALADPELAQRGVEQGTRTQDDAIDADYGALATTALQQWQELTHRMLDAFHQQFAAATGEIQRQGQRTFDQAAEAIQAGTRALQSGAQPAEASAQQPAQTRGKGERKQHEPA